jgi:hypothetical protein
VLPTTRGPTSACTDPRPGVSAGRREAVSARARNASAALASTTAPRSVLLGADDLLALVQEQRLVRRVADEQPVDGGALVELLDERAVLDRGGECTVLKDGRPPEDRVDGERADDLRLAEGERGGERVHAGGSVPAWGI